MRIVPGVVSIQGDYHKHVEAFHDLGHQDVRRIREPADLKDVTHVIIPGGESTTVGMLMERFGLNKALIEAAGKGTAIWGTCMGMIVMASKVEDREQPILNLLDITVRRNAFGAQIHSFEDEVKISGLKEPVPAVFIRAPIVTKHGPNTKVLAKYQDKIVGVIQGKLLGTSFHPELTPDRRLHELFLNL